jgi:FkbM family methyltransferase
VRFKALRPELWRALLTLAPPRDLAVIGAMAFRRERSWFDSKQTVRLRPLGGRSVVLRPRTSDARVVLDVFVGLFHVPPPAVSDPELIVDLGANIGLTVAHFAELFPRARVIGLEPEPEMADIARSHVAPWGERCSILTAAAWSKDGELTLAKEAGQEFAASVSASPADEGSLVVEAISLDTLLEDEDRVDYLKMDIEGAEGEVLSVGTTWAEKVRCINVEIHPPNTIESVSALLTDLGFEVSPVERHWAAVMGVRPGG